LASGPLAEILRPRFAAPPRRWAARTYAAVHRCGRDVEVYFDFDSSVITEQAKPQLNEIADVLRNAR